MTKRIVVGLGVAAVGLVLLGARWADAGESEGPAVACVASADGESCACRPGGEVCAGQHAVQACSGQTCCVSAGTNSCYCTNESKCWSPGDVVTNRCDTQFNGRN